MSYGTANGVQFNIGPKNYADLAAAATRDGWVWADFITQMRGYADADIDAQLANIVAFTDLPLTTATVSQQALNYVNRISDWLTCFYALHQVYFRKEPNKSALADDFYEKAMDETAGLKFLTTTGAHLLQGPTFFEEVQGTTHKDEFTKEKFKEANRVTDGGGSNDRCF